ncbi:MAG: phosphodiesterase [Clostridia bacterium]|nr:phosphodiesterase [Clostridia bacterium]
MKLLIASDIHGSAYYCDLLLKEIEKENPDKILILGDILYHGPRNDLPKGYAPKEVIAMLNPLKDKLLCVRGNCDAEVDQMVLNFPIMADYETLSFGDKTLFLSHGHVYGKDKLPQMEKGDILLGGHTHVPEIVDIEGKIYMNCGSVSIPKENSPHSYMFYENGEFLWKNLENGEVYKSFK